MEGRSLRSNRNEHPGAAAGLQKQTQEERSAIAAAKKAEKQAAAREKKRVLDEKKAQKAVAAKELAKLQDQREQERREREQSLREVAKSGVQQEPDEEDDGMDVDPDLIGHVVDGKTATHERKVKCFSFHVTIYLSPSSRQLTAAQKQKEQIKAFHDAVESERSVVAPAPAPLAKRKATLS